MLETSFMHLCNVGPQVTPFLHEDKINLFVNAFLLLFCLNLYACCVILCHSLEFFVPSGVPNVLSDVKIINIWCCYQNFVIQMSSGHNTIIL